MYFAYLDLETIQAAYAASPDDAYEALWRLTHRGCEVMLIAQQRNQPTLDWLRTHQLDYGHGYVCLYQSQCFSWLDRLRKRVPTFMEWKQHLVKSCLQTRDLDVERSLYAHSKRTLFIDQDKHFRQVIIDLYDPYIGCYSSLQEALASFEPLPQMSEDEVVRYHILRRAHEQGLIDTTQQLIEFERLLDTQLQQPDEE